MKDVVDLSDGAILVVGASRGVGKAVAEKFAAEGMVCIKAARSFKNTKLQRVATCYTIRLDVTNEESVKSMFEAISAEGVTLKAIIFSAGVGHFGPFESLTQEQWKECIDINLTGGFNVLHAGYAFFLDKKVSGKLVVIGSVADHMVLSGNAAYAASKFGLRGLTSIIHEEGRAHNVTATLVSLGATYTDIWRSRPEFSEADMLSPSEVALTIFSLVNLPSKVTVSNIIVTPPKGIL